MKKSLLATTLLAGLALPSYAADLPTLRMCTGSDQGSYFGFGKELKLQLNGTVNVELINTNGSVDNLDRVKAGECDALMAQSDATYTYKNPPDIDRVGVAYNEWVHLICNKSSGVDSVGVLEDDPTKHTLLLGKAGSGNAVTWDGFVKLDDDYGLVPTKPIGGEVALSKVIDGQDADCTLQVAGLGSPMLKNADSLGGKNLVLVPIDDGDFNDAEDAKGNAIYTFEEFPDDVYPNMQDCGWTCNNPDTLVLGAVFYVTTEWATTNDAAYGKVNTAFQKAKTNWEATH